MQVGNVAICRGQRATCWMRDHGGTSVIQPRALSLSLSLSLALSLSHYPPYLTPRPRPSLLHLPNSLHDNVKSLAGIRGFDAGVLTGETVQCATEAAAVAIGEGGRSTVTPPHPAQAIYFISIIDLLQKYDISKTLETKIKRGKALKKGAYFCLLSCCLAFFLHSCILASFFFSLLFRLCQEREREERERGRGERVVSSVDARLTFLLSFFTTSSSSSSSTNRPADLLCSFR